MIWLTQLVFDAKNPDAIMLFWGQALGYNNPLVDAGELAKFRKEYPQFDGRGRMDDNDLRRTPIYIQQVPESKVSENRIRLEVLTNDRHGLIDRLRSVGAAESPDGQLVDVEGNEFDVIEAPGEVRLGSVVMSARNPQRLLEFWSEATGSEADIEALRCDPPRLPLEWTGDHFDLEGQALRHICGAGGPVGPARFDLTPGIKFVGSPGPKQTKNRLHLDLNSTDVEADRARLEALGARILRWDSDQVLADPEGNEFCLSGKALP